MTPARSAGHPPVQLNRIHQPAGTEKDALHGIAPIDEIKAQNGLFVDQLRRHEMHVFPGVLLVEHKRQLFSGNILAVGDSIPGIGGDIVQQTGLSKVGRGRRGRGLGLVIEPQ